MTSDGLDRHAVTRVRQTLRQAGFHPIPVAGKKALLAEWQKTIAGAAEIDAWETLHPDWTNTGILTFNTPAIDLDLLLDEAAEAGYQMVRDRFAERGRLVVRVGQWPKRAVLFRTDRPFTKINVTLIAPNGSEQKVEFLADGQQLVVDGIHPDTREPYRYVDGGITDLQRSNLPQISAAEARQLVDDIVAMLVDHHHYRRKSTVPKPGNGALAAVSGSDWSAFFSNSIDHDQLAASAMALLAAGMSDGAAVNLMRAAVLSHKDSDPMRQQRRAFEIPFMVRSARAKLDRQQQVLLQPPPPSQSPQPPLVFVNKSRWDDAPPQPQQWAVADRIPRHHVTLLSGEGAAGKSTIGLHLAAAHVLERDWLGALPEPGPAIFIDAEDHADVMHRRLYNITRYYNCRFADLKDLHLVSLAGQDAVMATVSKNGKVEPTDLFHRVLQAAADIKPQTVIIASAADVYAGSEIDRAQVTQFVRGFLQRIAIAADGAVVLISHPSLTGISSGTGISGSTQWHNAMRARMYLHGVKPDGEDQPDTDLRILEFMKNQYGPRNSALTLRYQNGLFLPEGTIASFDKLRRDGEADEAFVALVARYAREGRSVSHKRTARNFAAAEFVSQPEARTLQLTKAQLAAAMDRLFAAGRLAVEPYGKPSRGWERIVIRAGTTSGTTSVPHGDHPAPAEGDTT